MARIGTEHGRVAPTGTEPKGVAPAGTGQFRGTQRWHPCPPGMCEWHRLAQNGTCYWALARKVRGHPYLGWELPAKTHFSDETESGP